MSLRTEGQTQQDLAEKLHNMSQQTTITPLTTVTEPTNFSNNSGVDDDDSAGQKNGVTDIIDGGSVLEITTPGTFAIDIAQIYSCGLLFLTFMILMLLIMAMIVNQQILKITIFVLT